MDSISRGEWPIAGLELWSEQQARRGILVNAQTRTLDCRTLHAHFERKKLRGHIEEGKPFEIQTLGPSIVDIEYALKMPKPEDLPEG